MKIILLALSIVYAQEEYSEDGEEIGVEENDEEEDDEDEEEES